MTREFRPENTQNETNEQRCPSGGAVLNLLALFFYTVLLYQLIWDCSGEEQPQLVHTHALGVLLADPADGTLDERGLLLLQLVDAHLVSSE